MHRLLEPAGAIAFSGLTLPLYRHKETGELGAMVADVSEALAYGNSSGAYDLLVGASTKLVPGCAKISSLAAIREPRTNNELRIMRIKSLRLAAQTVIDSRKNSAPRDEIIGASQMAKPAPLARMSDPVSTACAIIEANNTLEAVELAAQSLADRVRTGALDRGVVFARLFLAAKDAGLSDSSAINGAIRRQLVNGEQPAEQLAPQAAPEPEEKSPTQLIMESIKQQLEARRAAEESKLAHLTALMGELLG